MAKTAIPPRTFLTGFNQGYLLAKHRPELFNNLLSSLNTSNEIQKAILLGKAQYDKEQMKRKSENAPQKNNREKDREYDLDKDR